MNRAPSDRSGCSACGARALRAIPASSKVFATKLYILGIYIWGFVMRPISDSLLLKFRAKDTRFGVTRETVKALASELDTTETQVVHLALSRLAEELLAAYEPDDGPLTAGQLASIRKSAKAKMPKGAVLDKQRLF